MENIAIIYWSGTGNTESMANAIAEGIAAAGSTADIMLSLIHIWLIYSNHRQCCKTSSSTITGTSQGSNSL